MKRHTKKNKAVDSSVQQKISAFLRKDPVSTKSKGNTIFLTQRPYQTKRQQKSDFSFEREVSLQQVQVQTVKNQGKVFEELQVKRR